MKARKFLLAGLTAGVALTVASCGGSGRSANYVAPEEFDTTQQMTIRFYHTMGDSLQQVLQSAIDGFQAKYPNVTIESTQVGGYDDVREQIVTQIPNGNEPHIAYCYPDHVALYNKANAVVQLDSLIENEKFGFTKEQVADFVPGYYEEGKQFGDEYMYTLPFSKSTEVLYYNKTEFDNNGWTVPTTWQEMKTMTEIIKEKYPKSIPLGIDSESNLFITLTEQTNSEYTSASGDHFLFDNEKNRSMVQWFKDWYDKNGDGTPDGYYTTQEILGSYTSSLFTASKTASTGYSLMSIGSTGGASHQFPSDKSFEVGVAPIPKWEGGELKCISQGPSLCLFNKDNAQEVLASWLFMKEFLLTTDFQAAFSFASGYNPVLQSVYDNGVLAGQGANGADLKYSDWLNSAKGTTKDGLIALTAKISSDLTNNYYTSPAFVGSSTARDQVGSLFVAAISNTKTIANAFADAILECED